MKIMTWNTSKAKLVNKINNLIYTIQQHKSMIMAVQELNFTTKDDLADITIPGYTIEMDQLIKTTGRSRAALIIRALDITRYYRRMDLETGEEAHVWITVQLPGNSKINFQSLYRQWQTVGVDSRVPLSGTPAKQKERLWKVAQK